MRHLFGSFLAALTTMKAGLAIVISVLLFAVCTPPVTADERIDNLIKILDDPDKSAQTRVKAIKDLAGFKDKAEPAVPSLIKCLSNKALQDPACEALGNIGPGAKSALPALLELLGTNGTNARDALAAIDKIGPDPKTFVPVAIGLLKTPARKNTVQSQVQTGVMRTLGNLGPDCKDAVPVLIPFVEIGKKDTSFATSSPRAAIIALGQIGAAAEPALPALRELLANKYHGKQAEEAIAQIKKATEKK